MNEYENKVFCTRCKHLSRIYDGAFCANQYTTYVSELEGEFTRTHPYIMPVPKYQHMCFKNFKIKTENVITPIDIRIVTVNDSEDNIEDCLLKNANNDCADYEKISYMYRVPYNQCKALDSESKKEPKITIKYEYLTDNVNIELKRNMKNDKR